MKLRLSPRALREAKRIKSWWVNKRQATELFEEEFAKTLDTIVATPTIGTSYANCFEVGVRRVLMKKTNNHIYFTVQGDEIVILSVWGAPKKHGPTL